MVLFAHDTNILLTEKDLTSLKGKIVNVTNNYKIGSLQITEKTKAILFQQRGSSSIHRPVLYLSNKEIIYLSNLKFFGIHITENLI
jgi:hypothetical protein